MSFNVIRENKIIAKISNLQYQDIFSLMSQDLGKRFSALGPSCFNNRLGCCYPSLCILICMLKMCDHMSVIEILTGMCLKVKYL